VCLLRTSHDAVHICRLQGVLRDGRLTGTKLAKGSPWPAQPIVVQCNLLSYIKLITVTDRLPVNFPSGQRQAVCSSVVTSAHSLTQPDLSHCATAKRQAPSQFNHSCRGPSATGAHLPILSYRPGSFQEAALFCAAPGERAC
jgi:hypothetical protein